MFLDLSMYIDRNRQQFYCKPSLKYESVFIFLSPHSEFLEEEPKGIMNRLIRQFWKHSCRVKDYNK